MQEVPRLIERESVHPMGGREAPDLSFLLQDEVVPRPVGVRGGAAMIEVIRRGEAGETGPEDDDAQRSLTGPCLIDPFGRG